MIGNKKALSVSIVLYKTSAHDIDCCMNSLSRCNLALTIYIIDNSPTDILRRFFDENTTVYIHNPSNPGFGAAHNLALEQSAAAGFAYHLVINADVRFGVDVLIPMLEHMEHHPRVGQMMPCVKNPDGTLQRLCKLVPTPVDLLFRRILPRRMKEAHSQHFELHASGYDQVMFVPYLSGCFMLLRQAALQEVGYFDERFFMYPEDIDLTRRIAEKYETVFYPLVSVTHSHGAASQTSFKMFVIHAVNIVRYFNKWGWLFDSGRTKLNQKTLKQFG
jgi:GT2 family glycosyltransferase